MPDPKLASIKVPGYELISELGRGGMGVVYKARQVALDRLVALKMVLAGGHASHGDLERFRTEAQAVAKLQHPNVVQVYEVGIADEIPFLSLEYVNGGSLADRLHGLLHCPLESTRIVELLARAVHFAHERGIVHRDLKPANVLLATGRRADNDPTKGECPACAISEGGETPDEEFIPKLTDFGLAKRMGELGGQTLSGAVMGTPSYMSPEQASGKTSEIGPATDIYALGVILYELLVGRPPFRGQTASETIWMVMTAEVVPPSRLAANVPRDLETICLKSLHREPTRRYSTAAELAEDLRRYLSGEPIKARPIGYWERFWLWKRRNPQLAMAFVVAVFAMLSGMGLAIALALVQTWAAAEQAASRKQINSALQRTIYDEGQLALERGMAFCLREEASRGLPYLAWSLRRSSQVDWGELSEPLTNWERPTRINLSDWSTRVHPLKEILPHSSAVRAMALSPNGKLLVTGAQDGSIVLWDLQAEGMSTSQPSHDSPIVEVVISPSGRYLASICLTGSAQLHDLTSGKIHGPKLTHQGPLQAVRFSPDGRMLATASRDGVAKIWHVETGALAQELRHPSAVNSIGFSPDGKLLLTGSADHQARFWSVERGEPVWKPLHHRGRILCVAFDPEGSIAATGGDDNLAQLWRVPSGEELQPPIEHPSAVLSLRFHPERKLLLTACDDNRARLWRVGGSSTLPLATMAHMGAIVSMTFSGDGNRILTGSEDTTARLWTLEGKPILAPLHHGSTVTHVALHPTGKLAFTASSDKSVRIWRLGEPKLPLYSMPHQAPVFFLAYDGDGERILSATRNREIYIWKSGSPDIKDLEHLPAGVGAAAWDRRGKTIVLGHSNGQVSVYDGQTRRRKAVFSKHQGPVLAICLNEALGLAATSDEDRQARIWRIEDGVDQTEALRPPSVVRALAFHPSGLTLACGGEDGALRWWAWKAGGALERAAHHEDRIDSLAFSPDGSMIASGSADNTARLWSFATGKGIGAVMQHDGDVEALAFAPNGRILLTGSSDNLARFWDVETQQLIGQPIQHEGTVGAVAFSPDGKTVLTGSVDAQARAWPVPSEARGGPTELEDQVSALTGLKLGSRGALTTLQAGEWHDLRGRLRYSSPASTP